MSLCVLNVMCELRGGIMNDIVERNLRGFISEYSDCYMFETDDESFSQQAVITIDAFLHHFTQDGDIIEINIKKVGNIHDK